MRKKILAALVVAAGVAFAGYNVMQSQSDKNLVSDLLMANVEALAADESGSHCKWKMIDCPGLGTGDYEACLSNGDGNSCSCGSVSRECSK